MVALKNENLGQIQQIAFDLEPPSFNLEFPSTLTKDMIIKVFSKIFETMKWHLYQEIKKVTAGRVDYYLTKNEMK